MDSTKTKGSNGVVSNAVVRLFMVIWDDQQGVIAPMVWDANCEGAICAGVCNGDRVALFTDRKAARKAIDISTRYALLLKAQGKPANIDFLGECRKCLRVVECQPNSPAG